MAKLTKALEPCMEDALACARDAEDRDSQVRACVAWCQLVLRCVV